MNRISTYKDINQTLRGLKAQVIDSVPYAEKVCPKFSDPRDLWNWLKPQLHFVEDNDSRVPGKKPRELLQTMQTCFEYGGEGDCDCFVITALACMISQGWHDLKIYLVGRVKRYPVHIYCGLTWRGKRIIFDLTNSKYNYERPGNPPYKFRQEIKVPWEKWNLFIPN